MSTLDVLEATAAVAEATKSSTIRGAAGVVPALRDKNGRVRSVATLPGYRKGYKPGNYGKRYIVQRLTMSEIDLLISGRSRTSASGLRDRGHIALLAGSGLRLQESLDLRLADMTMENGSHVVLVRCGKGGKMRRVGMLPFAGPHLDQWIDKRRIIGIDDDRGPLFCTIAKPNPGDPIGAPQFRTMLKRMGVLAGIEKRCNPHVLHHSLAMHLDHLGVPLSTISKQLGHSNAGTTGIYLRSMADEEVFDAMAAIRWENGRLAYTPGVGPDVEQYHPVNDLAETVRAAAQGEND